MYIKSPEYRKELEIYLSEFSDVFEKLAELDKRVSALEKGNGGEDAPSVEYPEYEVGKWYYKNAVCSL